MTPKPAGAIDLSSLVDVAAERIRQHVRETPLEGSPALSALCGADVYLKLENLQVTGSFKTRGAFNRLLAMPAPERERGLVAASSGNHGAAVAFAGRQLGARVLVFVPQGASPVKIEHIKRLGAEIVTFGDESGATEIHARAYARENGMTYVSPYNDELVIAGQGTVGAELLRQLPGIEAVVASVGGGGLIAGIASRLKKRDPAIAALGISPRNSMAMAASVRAGHVVETQHLPTLSDGTAGGVEPGAITLALCQRLVDEFVEVSEEEIASALRLFIEEHHMLCEGAAAVAIAGLVKSRGRLKGKTVAVVVCGANISAERLKEAL